MWFSCRQSQLSPMYLAFQLLFARRVSVAVLVSTSQARNQLHDATQSVTWSSMQPNAPNQAPQSPTPSHPHVHGHARLRTDPVLMSYLGHHSTGLDPLCGRDCIHDVSCTRGCFTMQLHPQLSIFLHACHNPPRIQLMLAALLRAPPHTHESRSGRVRSLRRNVVVPRTGGV